MLHHEAPLILASHIAGRMTSTTSKHHSNAEASGVYARGVVTPSPKKEQHKNKTKTRETEKKKWGKIKKTDQKLP